MCTKSWNELFCLPIAEQTWPLDVLEKSLFLGQPLDMARFMLSHRDVVSHREKKFTASLPSFMCIMVSWNHNNLLQVSNKIFLVTSYLMMCRTSFLMILCCPYIQWVERGEHYNRMCDHLHNTWGCTWPVFQRSPLLSLSLPYSA